MQGSFRRTFGFALFVSLAGAQDTLELKTSAPAIVRTISASVSGNPGPGTYYYWVVANYPIGKSAPAGPAIATGVPALGGGNTVTVRWSPALGATSYDVLRATSPVYPAGTCICRVALAVVGTSQIDNGGALASYTLSALQPINATFTLDNQSDTIPRITLNRLFAPAGIDLASSTGRSRPIRVGAALPATCSTGELFFLTGVVPGQNVYGCPVANTWVLASGSGGEVNTGQNVGAGAYQWYKGKSGTELQFKTLNPGGPLSASEAANVITLNISQATAGQNGYLTSGDWTTFNSKVPTTRTLTCGAGLAGCGDLSADRTLNVVSNSTNQQVRIATGGTLRGTRRELNLIAGTNITLTPVDNDAADRVDITIAAGGGAGGYSTLQDEGVPLPPRATLNIIGAGGTCIDNGATGTTDCTITSGGGSGTVNAGLTGELAYYPGDGDAVDGLNRVFWDSGSGTLQIKDAGGVVRAQLDSATGFWTQGIGVTVGHAATIGNAGDTGSSSQTIYAGNADSKPAWLRLITFSGNDAYLYACGNSDGRLCVASSTPGAVATNPLLGTDTTDTVSNKTLDNSTIINSYYTVIKSAEPGNPAGTNTRIWVDTVTGLLSCKDSAGGNCMPSSGGPAGTHDLLSATHIDTTPAAVVRGDLLTGQGAVPTAWQRLALGGSGTYTRSNGTDLVYSAIQLADLPAGTVKTSAANTYTAGLKQAMQHDANTAGMNLTPAAGDPATPANGDMWYNSTSGKFRKYQDGAASDLDTVGGSAINITSPGVGYIWSFGAPQSTANANAMITALRVYFAQIVLVHAITINRIVINVSSAGTAGCLVNFGLYETDGDLIRDSASPAACDSSGYKTITLTSSYAAAPGVYLLAWAVNANGIAATAHRLLSYSGGSTIENFLRQTTSTRAGFGANAADAGVRLPATLGALTGTSTGSTYVTLLEP